MLCIVPACQRASGAPHPRCWRCSPPSGSPRPARSAAARAPSPRGRRRSPSRAAPWTARGWRGAGSPAPCRCAAGGGRGEVRRGVQAGAGSTGAGAALRPAAHGRTKLVRAASAGPGWQVPESRSGVRQGGGRAAGRQQPERTRGCPTLWGQSGGCGCPAGPAARTSPRCGTCPPHPSRDAGRSVQPLQAGRGRAGRHAPPLAVALHTLAKPGRPNAGQGNWLVASPSPPRSSQREPQAWSRNSSALQHSQRQLRCTQRTPSPLLTQPCVAQAKDEEPMLLALAQAAPNSGYSGAPQRHICGTRPPRAASWKHCWCRCAS